MKIKKSNHPNGLCTSFSFITFYASANDIIKKFGTPSYNEPWNYDDKVTREWELKLGNGTPFTVYDWKEERYFEDDERIHWHVGTEWSSKDREKRDEKVRLALEEAGFKTTWCK